MKTNREDNCLKPDFKDIVALTIAFFLMAGPVLLMIFIVMVLFVSLV